MHKMLCNMSLKVISIGNKMQFPVNNFATPRLVLLPAFLSGSKSLLSHKKKKNF